MTDRRARVIVHVTTVPMTLTFLRGHAAVLRRNGITMHAISSPGRQLAEFASAEGVAVHAVPMSRRVTPLRDLGAVVRAVRLIRSIRPDIVHAQTPKGGLVGMIAAAISRVPLRIYHMRGLPMVSATGPRRSMLWLTERISCALAHRVLCVSHSLRAAAIEAGVCPPRKIGVLGAGSGQGVDARGRFDPATVGPERGAAVRTQLGIPEGAKVIGFVGRMVRDKGIIELAEAWKYVRERHPEARLMLVGFWEGDDPALTACRTQLAADDRVHFTGECWDTPPLYAAMDIVVLPSYREGFPNVPLEAAAMERPVVTTRAVGCVDSIEDGITGTLVAVGSGPELANAICMYLDDPRAVVRHGRAGRERVLRSFQRDFVLDALVSEYDRLLGRSRAGLGLPSSAG